jgi:hypothetical protein
MVSRVAPSILFLADPAEDYVADTLFHGLRALLGASVVDYPKRAALYRSWPEERKDELYGRGFTIYGLLEDIAVDRHDALARAVAGEFDLVIVGSIWRDWHWWLEVHDRLPGSVEKAVVDGADVPWMYPYGPTWWRTPRGWVLPRAHRRATYFKREWTRATGWLRWWGLIPPPLSDRLPLEPIAISLPEEKVVPTTPGKRQDFATHVVDAEVARRLGRGRTGYAFDLERDYVADLRSSRFGITTRKAGWDALRHYEIAGNGSVPCFRDLQRKPPRCAPHGLRRDINCLAYRDADDLLRQATGMPEDRYAELAAGALAWARANTTRRRAERFLDSVGLTWT